ncbi:PREDICTED: juvenile hormone acid O-methyltransferase-like [Dinoponera quadriceps]|uniref:Juvenile hormone acid O-methyltransferase-like n=1 Tax=Dinoponera quadriceps TaxID=609295 RepID=A0A6P3YAY0_DINQU|nr:PREDICTED: juvenile hormone acid O-methyltransferase-like [Dinoponera quadriceps]
MADLKKYHQSDNASHSTIQFLIDEFDEELKNMSGNCIDIGCGNGDQMRYNLLPALDPKATIIGTDISENVIKHATEIHGDEERLKFKVLDIQTKNLSEEYISKFDNVFSFYTLHWCNDIL